MEKENISVKFLFEDPNDYNKFIPSIRTDLLNEHKGLREVAHFNTPILLNNFNKEDIVIIKLKNNNFAKEYTCLKYGFSAQINEALINSNIVLLAYCKKGEVKHSFYLAKEIHKPNAITGIASSQDRVKLLIEKACKEAINLKALIDKYVIKIPNTSVESYLENFTFKENKEKIDIKVGPALSLQKDCNIININLLLI